MNRHIANANLRVDEEEIDNFIKAKTEVENAPFSMLCEISAKLDRIIELLEKK